MQHHINNYELIVAVILRLFATHMWGSPCKWDTNVLVSHLHGEQNEIFILNNGTGVEYVTLMCDLVYMCMSTILANQIFLTFEKQILNVNVSYKDDMDTKNFKSKEKSIILLKYDSLITSICYQT